MKYMLDTNICINLIRYKPQSLIQRMTACAPGEVGVSSITIAELAHGANKSNQVEKNYPPWSNFFCPLKLQTSINKRQPLMVLYAPFWNAKARLLVQWIC